MTLDEALSALREADGEFDQADGEHRDLAIAEKRASERRHDAQRKVNEALADLIAAARSAT